MTSSFVNGVSTLDAVLRDDDEVLDPDAADAREVDARLERDDVAGLERLARLRPEPGASWTSRPTPWPSPWPKCSPKPAASITSRAAASASRPLDARPDLLERGELRLEADVVRARSSSGRSPVANVRVQSERSRRRRRPRRRRRACPGRDRASPGSACGLAPFAPAATIVSKASAVGAVLVEELAPSATRGRARSARRSAPRASAPNAASVIARAPADRLELVLLLDRAQLLDDARARHDSSPPARSAS